MKITPAAAMALIALLSKAATALPADWKIDPENNPPTINADFTQGSNPGIVSAHSATMPDLPSSSYATLRTFLLDGSCVASTSDSANSLDRSGQCDASDALGPLSTYCTSPISLESISTRSGYVASDVNSDDKPTLTVCEVVQLWLKGPNDMVIAETYTNIKVVFENTKTFAVITVDLEKADIKSVNTETSLSEYITATNCGGAIGPNDVLCILITSSSGDILIDRIDTMTINGNDDTTAADTLVVYEENVGIKYSAITEEFNNPDTNQPTRQAVKVETRVPSNIFNFEKEGAQITVGGTVTVEFAGGRRLIALDRLLQENGPETAEFDLTVDLARGPELDLEGGEAMMSSAKAATAGKAFAILGMVFAFAFSLW